jgi:hypothetical protein
VGTLPFLAAALWSGFAAATDLVEGNRDRALGLGVVTFMLLVFAGVPALIVWAVTAYRAENQDTAVRRSNHPDSPWLWREDWARGEVVHLEGTASIVALGLFAFVWNAAVVIMVVAALLHADPSERIVVIGLLGLFVLAGLFLVSVVVKKILKRVRYGRSVFVLDMLPATPGGQLSGVVQAPAGLAAASAFEVALYGLEARRGDDVETERVEWQDARTLPRSSVDRGPSGISIPVAFDIPADAAPTSPREQDMKRRLWRLTVKAAISGVDYDADFEVPVFCTDAPQRLSRRTVPARPPSLAPETEQPVTSRIRVEPTEGGTALQFPTPSWLRGWTLVPVLFVPAAAWLGRQPILAEVPYIVCVGAGVAAMLFFWGVTLLGLVMTPSRIEVLHDRVIVRRGLGRHGWDRTVRLGDVKSAVARTIGGQGQSQHSVDILTTSGGEYWAAIGLRDASEAKWLAGEIERLVHAAQGA